MDDGKGPSLKGFPKWSKVWIYFHASQWEFTDKKEDIPDGAPACEYVQNNDPFYCRVTRTVTEDRSA